MASKNLDKKIKNILDEYQEYIQLPIHKNCDDSCTLKTKYGDLIQDIKQLIKEESEKYSIALKILSEHMQSIHEEINNGK